MTILPILLCAYSLPHNMGYLPTKDGAGHGRPFSLPMLLELAERLNLAGIEAPLSPTAPVFDGKSAEVDPGLIELFAALRLRANGADSKMISVVADFGPILDSDAAEYRSYLSLASSVGAKVVRCIASNMLCGDRRGFPGGWQEHLEAVAARLTEILPAAEEAGISVAVENHQDLTSEDLWWLYEHSGKSSSFGTTLDTGNPLAVGEDPVAFARKVQPLLRHIHLKDYTIHFAPNGYRLVRCAAGVGVVDFPTILEIATQAECNVTSSIEIAAQATRTIPVLEPEWWSHYSAEQLRSFPLALKVLWDKGRPASEPYSSCWECGGNSEEVASDEIALVEASAEYFRSITGKAAH